MAMVVISVFAAFTLMCWVPDVVTPGTVDTYYLFFRSGCVFAVVAMIYSVGLWSSVRKVLLLGLLWVIWAALPRL